MAIRNIRLDSDPLLRKKSRNVDAIDDRISLLLDDMLETMYNAHGVGLAAPQIGVLRRVVVIDIGEGPIKMINPVIVSKEGMIRGEEGCLSVPNKQGVVDRPEKLKASYLNENGVSQTIEAEGYLARAICHELDHLDGILYTDKALEVYEVEREEEV